MTIPGWTVVFFSTISYVSCRPKGVFDSIMSPTFMQPHVNQTMFKPDHLFDDFFDKNTSFAAMARSASAAGDDLMKFNFSAVVPMSRSSSSSTFVSSHTSTNSQSVSNLPKKEDNQGVNITKTVENVQVMMPKSSSSIKELKISTNIPGAMFGFVGPTAEKDLHDRLVSAKPLYLKGVTDILSMSGTSPGQYFTIFPVQSSSPRTFYIISNTLPDSLLSKSVGKILTPNSRGGVAAVKPQHVKRNKRSSLQSGDDSTLRQNR